MLPKSIGCNLNYKTFNLVANHIEIIAEASFIAPYVTHTLILDLANIMTLITHCL